MASKQGPTATVQPVEASPAAIEEAVFRTERRVKQAIYTIVCGVALPCIPIIVITAVLLYFIFHYQIHLNPGYEGLRLAGAEHNHNVTSLISLIRREGGTAAYYVKFNPSTITTIASWTSRIVPYLSSSVMALVAFFAARHIVLSSKHGDEHGTHLPTPEQLTLLISVLGGSGFGPLRDTLLHRYQKKEKLIAPLPAAFTALFIITFLALLIPLIDSWFGIATKAVVETQLIPSSGVIFSYGRDISSDTCVSGPRDHGSSNQYETFPADAWWPCNVVNAIGHGAIFPGVGQAARTLFDGSLDNKLYNYTDSTGTQYQFLGDPQQSAGIDFQATTIATTSQCVPMTQLCYYNFDAIYQGGQGYAFNCTPAFSGSIYDAMLNQSADPSYIPDTSTLLNVGIAFSKNPELTVAGDMFTVTSAYPGGGALSISQAQNYTYPVIYPTNPLYYGAWAAGYPAVDLVSTEVSANFPGDTGIFLDTNNPNQGGIWMFNCSTTVWNVNYTWVNGVVQKFETTLASPDLAAMLSASLAWSQYDAQISNTLEAITEVASNTGETSRDISYSFGQQVGRMMLAYSIGALENSLNILQQERMPGLQLARIPLVPLYLLLATKFIYVVAVIVLAIGAYCFTHPGETEVVKAQLSIKGLAAAHFNKPDLMRTTVVQQIQERLDATTHKDGGDKSKSPHTEITEVEVEGGDFEKKPLQHASTAPEMGQAVPPPQNAKVGLLPTAEGGWEFVLLANGVWNSIKPIVKSLVVQDANAGGLGEVGQVIKAW